MKRSISLFGFLILTIIFLSVVQVAVSSKLSTVGIELDELEEKINLYEKENTNLSEKYLFETSLTNVASKAAQLGFVEKKSRIYLTTPLPLAVKQ